MCTGTNISETLLMPRSAKISTLPSQWGQQVPLKWWQFSTRSQSAIF